MFAVFKVEEKVLVEKDLLAIRDTGSLSFVLKSFRNLRGMVLLICYFLAWLFCRELHEHLLVL